jgi:hypothetical protein
MFLIIEHQFCYLVCVRSLTWPEVWRRRLDRHSLLAPTEPDQMVEVVRAVSGIHAQMMPAAELSIGIRVQGVTQADVRNALWERRSLVKTYGLRGTIHLFPADELWLWTAALRARPQPREERRLEELGLTLAQVDAVIDAIGEALDNRRLTREELGAEVVRRAGTWAGDAVSPAFGSRWPRWQIALGHAANAGVLCFGPNLGGRVTFVRPDQWIGPRRQIDGSEALQAVLLRYLATYGPATHRDFAQWFAIPPGAAGELLRSLSTELEEVDVEGYRAWLPRARAADDAVAPRESVHLLPHFDCYLIGCHPRNRLVHPAWAERVLAHGSAGNRPVVLIDGMVAGLWQQETSGRTLEIRVELFERSDAGRYQALEAAAARIAEIKMMEARLTLGTVQSRPHL